MKKISFLLLSLLLSAQLKAELIRFRAPAIAGKITSETIDLTDWQAVMTCHYLLSGKPQEVMKYPNTYLKKNDSNNYSITIKAMTLFEALPHLELQNCSYKLILIGKNKSTHQTAFGEIYLIGTDHGTMSEKELEQIQNKDVLAKILQERTKDIIISNGLDGGIILAKTNEE